MVEGGRWKRGDSLDVSEMEESLPQASPFSFSLFVLGVRRVARPDSGSKISAYSGTPSKHNHRPTTCCLLTPSKLGGHQTAGPGAHAVNRQPLTPEQKVQNPPHAPGSYWSSRTTSWVTQRHPSRTPGKTCL
jgi:hypothetical protein